MVFLKSIICIIKRWKSGFFEKNSVPLHDNCAKRRLSDTVFVAWWVHDRLNRLWWKSIFLGWESSVCCSFSLLVWAMTRTVQHIIPPTTQVSPLSRCQQPTSISIPQVLRDRTVSIRRRLLSATMSFISIRKTVRFIIQTRCPMVLTRSISCWAYQPRIPVRFSWRMWLTTVHSIILQPTR